MRICASSATSFVIETVILCTSMSPIALDVSIFSTLVFKSVESLMIWNASVAIVVVWLPQDSLAAVCNVRDGSKRLYGNTVRFGDGDAIRRYWNTPPGVWKRRWMSEQLLDNMVGDKAWVGESSSHTGRNQVVEKLRGCE